MGSSRRGEDRRSGNDRRTGAPRRKSGEMRELFEYATGRPGEDNVVPDGRQRPRTRLEIVKDDD